MLRNTDASLFSLHSQKSSVQLPWDQMLLSKRIVHLNWTFSLFHVAVTIHFPCFFPNNESKWWLSLSFCFLTSSFGSKESYTGLEVWRQVNDEWECSFWVNYFFKWADIRSAYLRQMGKEIKHKIKVII